MLIGGIMPERTRTVGLLSLVSQKQELLGFGTSQVVQWLRVRLPVPGGVGSIPGQAL